MKNILYLFAFVLIFVSCEQELNDYPQGSISGKVVDAETGIGLSEIELTLEPILAANGNTKTLNDGTFNLSRIVEGKYLLRVKKTGTSIVNSIEEELFISGNQVFEYKLTPRVSVSDFELIYDKKDNTTFTVKFKGKANQENKFNYYALMWDFYPNKVFGEHGTTNRKAVKNTSLDNEISYTITGLDLEKHKTHYVRVGASHLPAGGDYNHSKCLTMRFE